MAIDGSSGAYDDDPEQAGDSKPEKGRGPSGQDVSRPADTQPAEVRNRAEYYEELRATDKQMAAADGHSDRPRWTHCTLRRNAPSTFSTGIAGVAGTGTGQAGPGKRNSLLAGTTRRSSGTS